jgi:hypothetical protein
MDGMDLAKNFWANEWNGIVRFATMNGMESRMDMDHIMDGMDLADNFGPTNRMDLVVWRK